MYNNINNRTQMPPLLHLCHKCLDGQTDRQTDKSKSTCPPLKRGHKNFKIFVKYFYREICTINFDVSEKCNIPSKLLEYILVIMMKY